MNPIPLLFISDAPSANSGLGRITRDLAVRVHEHCSDLFRIATFGYGGFGSRNLPFPQYTMQDIKDWVLPELPEVWQDFAGDEFGVVMTIWDASRLLWFARPEYCRDAPLGKWLKAAPFERWGYFPIDATGPNNRLSIMLGQTMLGYDRIVSYSKWSEGLIQSTIGKDRSNLCSLTTLPHGIDTSVFKPYSRSESRKIFHDILGFKGPEIVGSDILIGIVATNQHRKDFGLAIETVTELGKTVPLRLFIQTDTLERFWSMPALLMDFGLLDRTIVNCVPVSDSIMAGIYSACDLTLGIGAGEGFGYPIFESLACKTPVVTGNYGGHAEWLPDWMLVEQQARRWEGLYNCRRPVFHPKDWVQAINRVLAKHRQDAKLPERLAWNNLWPEWKQWFRAEDRIHLLRVKSQLHSNSTSEKGKESATSKNSTPCQGAFAAIQCDPTVVEPSVEPL